MDWMHALNVRAQPEETIWPIANGPWVKGSQQRYGLLLLALGATFFFEGFAEPGDLQRAVETVLVSATLSSRCAQPRSQSGACALRPRSVSPSWQVW